MPLEERRLGRTGLVLPELGLGAMDTPQAAEGADTLRAALDLGVRFVDTARDYQGSEYLIGQVVRERGGDFCIASKTFSRTVNGSQADVDRSLAVLGVRSICLYQLHDVSTADAWDQVMAPGGALEGSASPSSEDWSTTSASPRTALRLWRRPSPAASSTL